MARLFTGPFFPYLEERLADEIASAKRHDPFRPLAVIVPTRALVRRLQSILAARGSWLNVNFFTFFTLALSALAAARREVRPIPPGAVMPLLLRQAIESHLPQNEHTAYFLSYRSSMTRLLSLFSRFTSYRVTAPTRLTGIEKTLFSIYQSFYDLKQDREIRDADDLIGETGRLLASGIPHEIPSTLFLYGFYDLNPAQRDIVRHLDARGDLTIFSPGGFSDGTEEFFRETAAFYRGLSETAGDPDRPLRAQSEPVILSIARELFSTPGSTRREAGGLIEMITASGPYGEARAVALEIIGLKEQNPALQWHDISIAVRDLVDFTDVLSDAFDEFSIPAVFDGGRPLSSIPEIGYFLVLISALERGLPRDDVSFLISSALFAWPGLPTGDEPWVRDNAYLLAAIARRYRVISGKKEWENAFNEHRNHAASTDPLGEEIEGAGSDDLEQSMTRYIQAVQPIVIEFLSALADIPAEASPSEYHDRFTSLIDTYARPADGRYRPPGYLKEILDILTVVSSIRHSITRDDCIALLRDTISERKAPFAEDIDGVFVSDVMGARGLPRKVLFLMGMNEKVFPRVPGRDAFLSDETGRILGLPTSASRSLEDRTLFAMTVASARDLLILTRQRSDDAGRTLSPSPFLAELASRITIGGTALPLASPPSRPTRRDYPRITATDTELSRYRTQDMHASLCLRWPRESELRAVRGVVLATPFLREGLAALDERASDRPFGKYDGFIGRADGLMDMIVPLSSQKLETYASCPFDFFMHHILSTRQEEAVEEELDVESRELGLLYHRILSRLLPLLVQKGLFASATADREAVDGLVKTYVKKETLRMLSGRVPTLILRAREEHATGIVGRLVGREMDGSTSGFLPSLYEVAFGSGRNGQSENPALALIIGQHTIHFVGRIDRIDSNESDATFAVVDYKRKRGSGARKLKTEILAGRHFQLPIYLMAADAVIFNETRRPGGGALVYLEAEQEKDYRETLSGEEYEETRDAVIKGIGSVIDAMLAGRFTPSRSNSCRFCTFRDLCRSDIKPIGTIRREMTADGLTQIEEDDGHDET